MIDTTMSSGLSVLGSTPGGFAAPRLIAGGNSADEQRAFSEVMGVARGHDANATPEQKRADAKEAAEKLVASAFIAPLMKSMRESNQAAAPFAPTPAEKQFRGLMDARVAESIVKRSGFGLVDRITDDLVRAAGLEEKDAAHPGARSSGLRMGERSES